MAEDDLLFLFEFRGFVLAWAFAPASRGESFCCGFVVE